MRPFIVAFLFLILLAPSIASAQKGGEQVQTTYDCAEDCPETPFDPINKSSSHTFNFGGCTWRVYFLYRQTTGCSTGEYCDIQVTQVRCLTVPPCTTYTTAQIFNVASVEAIKAALAAGLLTCDPVYPNCATNWRVDAGSCWKQGSFNYGSIDIPDWVYIVGPCSVDGVCCYFAYTLCRDQYNNLIVTQTSTSSNAVVCPSGCTKICGQL